MFRAIFGRKVTAENGPQLSNGGGQLHPAIRAHLQRLDVVQPGLGKPAIAFVAKGEPSSVIGRIENAHHATSRYNNPFFRDYAAVEQVERATALALVTGEIAPGPEVARLMRVDIALKAVTSPYDKKMTLDELALSRFFSLINLGTSLPEFYKKIPWERMISLTTMLAHVQQLGGTMVDLLGYALHSPTTPLEGSWVASADLAHYARTYPEALAEAIRNSPIRPDAIRVTEQIGATTVPEIEALLLSMLTKSFDKNDRETATSAIARLAPDQLMALLKRELPRADVDTRHRLVQAAGRAGTPEVLALLAERGRVEKAAKVRAAIEMILGSDAVDPEDAAGADRDAGYAAIDGRFITLPERLDLGAGYDRDSTDAVRAEFLQLVARFKEHERERFGDDTAKHPNRAKSPLIDPSSDMIEATFSTMTEGTAFPTDISTHLLEAIRLYPMGGDWLRGMVDRLPTHGVLKVLGASDIKDDVSGLLGMSRPYFDDERMAVDLLRGFVEQGRLDLRDIGTTKHLRTLLTTMRYRYDRTSPVAALAALPADAVWPWLAEEMDFLDEAIGLKPAQSPVPLDRTLEVMALLPVLPQRYLAKMLEIAVTERRPLRRQAMALLRPATDLHLRVEALLDDKRQQVRINAATWLADIRSAASESALRARLKKEKSDPVRAALIESLQRMGFDLSDVVGPAVLIAEAEAAGARGTVELPDWLAAKSLPSPHFRGGATVPPLVVRHWLALAIRLKDPAASGQFGIFLDQLEPGDARAFSNWVLDSWISYDTASASIEEATAYALANYQKHYNWLYDSNRTPELRDRVIAQIVREKAGEMVNSGAETKGMLALACRADPVFAANRVRWFLKKHGRRSNQAMALLEVLVGIGHPAALQVLIAASVRLKQKSTQARAAEIAERYAEDRGWSVDELADRTVPTAGFDDEGVLELACGEDGKRYTARLDAMLAIHLFNPDGKAVKSLPAGDDEATRESKKSLSTARKELAQVIELQGSRLFEAMCVERAWLVADWRLAFHEHPVMRRLIERLVWQGLDEDGRPLDLFRPTQEGDFTDANDAPVEIDRFAKVRLAHGALVGEASCAAWIGHLKDYEIKPFLSQFDTLRAPLSAEQGEAEAIFDRQGWKAESLTFRGASEKRGYQRVVRDSGGCHEYEKKFPSQGITATIFHTGSYAHDDNDPVALKELRFGKEGQGRVLRLKDVPPVMLAECWADYHAIAAKGVFDPEWKKVSPW